MAIRTPLKVVSGDLQEMTAANITAIISRTVQNYFHSPSVTLSVQANGNLAGMTDTRMTAGAMVSRVGDGTTGDDGAAEFTPESSTAEPGEASVTFDLLHQTSAGATQVADTGGIRFPVYSTGGNIVAMSRQDMYDTFITGTSGAHQVIPTWQPYKISTSSVAGGVSGYTRVSTTPVFIDTVADITLYTADAAGLGQGTTASGGEALDQPETLNSYYLHKRSTTAPSTSLTAGRPLYIDASANLVEYSDAQFDVILKEVIRWSAENIVTATGVTGFLEFKLQTSSTGGTTCGSIMVNKKRNGVGAHSTYKVGADDYRAQEFPNGTATAVTNYYLKARNDP